MSFPSPIVGIDLGTTNSLVALAAPDAPPRILPDDQGRPMLPSVVRFNLESPPKPIELGYQARTAALEHPLSTIASVKRLMGRSLADAEPDLPYLSYQVVAADNGAARVALPTATGGGGEPYLISPQEVSAVILARLREQATSALCTPISRAVITVPAYFDDAQRQATREAARLAGLEAVRIINEPTAAALAYGLGLRESAGMSRAPKLIAVYDLGGGTFDISILQITPAQGDSDSSPADIFQVLSTAGDTHLGGDDMDTALIHLFTTEINQQFATPDAPLHFGPETLQALRQFAESAKIRLSTQDQVTVQISLPLPEGGGRGVGSASVLNRTYTRTLTRKDFETLIAPLVDRTLAACQRALRDAKRAMSAADKTELAAVVLVGGATRVPLVRAKVEEFFGIPPYTALDPDQVVALGAAVQASILARAGASAAPALLLDVVPLSLGLETVGGAMAKLIIRNSTVPARASERFSTSVDNQTAFDLHVLQGEREMAADCRSLARYTLRGIPPMPAGIPKLKVDFHVDASGILSINAVEERSGKRLAAQVVPNHGLTQAEVERIEREALTHARQDMQHHRVVDLVANSRLDVKWITAQFAKHADLLDPPTRADIQRRIDALSALIAQAERDWTSVDPQAFHQAKEDLDQASIRLHEVSIAQSLRDE